MLTRGLTILCTAPATGNSAGVVVDYAAVVGEAGEVVGVDRAPAAIAAAQARTGGQRNLSFLEGDPAVMSFERPFDAVVGRYVLMFQQHPASMLRALAPHLRPGGLIAFHELTYEGISSSPPLPTFDQVWRWNAETTRLYGANPDMGPGSTRRSSPPG